MLEVNLRSDLFVFFDRLKTTIKWTLTFSFLPNTLYKNFHHYYFFSFTFTIFHIQTNFGISNLPLELC